MGFSFHFVILATVSLCISCVSNIQSHRVRMHLEVLESPLILK